MRLLAGSTGGSATSGSTICRRSSSLTSSRKRRTGTSRWRCIAAATWASSSTAPGTCCIEQTIGFLLGGFFFAGARMLLGMGLMKIGVFSAQRSRSFYAWMAALGYGIGLPLMVFDALALIRHEFKDDYLLHGGIFYNEFGSLVVALGHVGLIMLIVQSGALSWLTHRLAAVGRMALSNYLTHSIVCTTLFYGYGFGLFGQINRTGLAAIVLAIWVFQLWISPIWLKHFRFGPAEWVWRSLTYWKLQPMRRQDRTATAARAGVEDIRPQRPP